MFSAAYRKWEIRLEGAGRGYKIVDWKKQIKGVPEVSIDER
jgi:hypothetical protein